MDAGVVVASRSCISKTCDRGLWRPDKAKGNSDGPAYRSGDPGTQLPARPSGFVLPQTNRAVVEHLSPWTACLATLGKRACRAEREGHRRA